MAYSSEDIDEGKERAAEEILAAHEEGECTNVSEKVPEYEVNITFYSETCQAFCKFAVLGLASAVGSDACHRSNLYLHCERCHAWNRCFLVTKCYL